MSRPRILIAHTGGTIGMKRRQDGSWAPAPGFLAEQVVGSLPFARDDVPDIEVEDFEPLMDSAEMAADDWVRIARRLVARLPDFDGAVLLHGTDTMAYTASALAFMLENLDKSVILTGSQVPLCELRNDGWRNLLTSVLLAAEERIPEVAIYFGDALYRGCRATKTDSFGFGAFDSPNYPRLAHAGSTIRVRRDLVRPAPDEGQELVLHETLNPFVAGLWLYPGITAEVVRNFLRPPLAGAVIQAYGVGNGPASQRDIMDAFREARDRGVVLVDVSQCVKGGVHIEDYATGRGLAAAGLVSGYDMTHEAALTKLSFLFGRGYGVEEVRELVGIDLRGELTRND